MLWYFITFILKFYGSWSLISHENLIFSKRFVYLIVLLHSKNKGSNLIFFINLKLLIKSKLKNLLRTYISVFVVVVTSHLRADAVARLIVVILVVCRDELEQDPWNVLLVKMIQLELEKDCSKGNTLRIWTANKAVTVGFGDGDQKKPRRWGGGKRKKMWRSVGKQSSMNFSMMKRLGRR